MSTDDQPTLSAFVDGREPRPQWQPGGRDRRCRRCGRHVTARFGRVFGDRRGRVHACHECLNHRAVTEGAAADPDVAAAYGEQLTDAQKNTDNAPGVPGDKP